MLHSRLRHGWRSGVVAAVQTWQTSHVRGCRCTFPAFRPETADSFNRTQQRRSLHATLAERDSSRCPGGGKQFAERNPAVFFRFAAGLLLVVAVSMGQVALEKQSLQLLRLVSRQYYQMDELLELHAQLRLDIQRLATPSQFVAGFPQSSERPRPEELPDSRSLSSAPSVSGLLRRAQVKLSPSGQIHRSRPLKEGALAAYLSASSCTLGSARVGKLPVPPEFRTALFFNGLAGLRVRVRKNVSINVKIAAKRSVTGSSCEPTRLCVVFGGPRPAPLTRLPV